MLASLRTKALEIAEDAARQVLRVKEHAYPY